ncbi:hypothetical protein [Vibrio ziniensis]|uniref:Uncharacterized protein n=1 Tax=Vibrio ziniensis TaxID=2711221 RepID=A0A6G7CHB8_9VIBR|nr:hypothetical protein [Vibrio ziniensis]QIH41470.1 hypothetical protein G5S32_05435 [Vibrio ziniensis]
MNKRFKRVSLAIYLDPLQSIPDSFAYNTFIGWSKKRKELAADATAAMELHQLVHIHKDIYMSGMFLHCLKPELATSFAAALSNDSITEQSLLDILKVHQIYPHSVQNGINEGEVASESKSIDVDAVIDNVSSKIEHLLEMKLSEHLSQIDFSAGSMPSVPDFTHITEHMSSQLAQHQQSLVEHIAAHANTQFESKIDAQSLSQEIVNSMSGKFAENEKALRDLITLMPSSSSNDIDTLALSQDIASIISSQLIEHQKQLLGSSSNSAQMQLVDQQALSHDIAMAIGDKLDHSQQISELKSVVTQQNTLINQLMQQIRQQGGVVTTPANFAEPQESVEERLEKVQRLKKKGVF